MALANPSQTSPTSSRVQSLTPDLLDPTNLLQDLPTSVPVPLGRVHPSIFDIEQDTPNFTNPTPFASSALPEPQGKCTLTSIQHLTTVISAGFDALPQANNIDCSLWLSGVNDILVSILNGIYSTNSCNTLLTAFSSMGEDQPSLNLLI
jgi:hypothetical protein